MSRKKTLEQCDHISRVKEWGFNDDHNFVAALWDCVRCGVESSTPFREEAKEQIDHTKCGGPSKCFGCKAQGLAPLMNTGDAGRPIADKQWKANLKEYSDARKQGVQPSSTNVHAVRAAMEASSKIGRPYDANTMVRADKVTKSMAKAINEVGV